MNQRPPPPITTPIKLGPTFRIWPPVVLAPMSGVTNYPYRKICYGFGAGLCVSEMVSAKGILEGHRRTWRLACFGEDEHPRSVQIFGNDPRVMSESTRRLIGELGVEHVDINFGCPVHKLARKGMGVAVMADLDNCRRVVQSVVAAADPVPVTIKTRLGLDEDTMTFFDAGRIAEDAGCAWITLHGRTAEQKYSGRARWERIAELKEALSIPVLGNGDIFCAEDARVRMEQSGVDGVVIGRGCLGNPWLFRELHALFEGQPSPPRPSQEEVVAIVREHYRLLCVHFKTLPREAMLRMRKLGSWYAGGFRGAAELRRRFQTVETEEDLEHLLALWLEMLPGEEQNSLKGA